MKLTKQQQIVQLQKECDYQKNEAEKYQERYETEKRRVDNSLTSLDKGRIGLEDIARQLFEIVRWHVNPETARYPYQGTLKTDEKKLDEHINSRW